MAIQIGVANGYQHLLELLKDYISGSQVETSRSYTGTGNGTLSFAPNTAASQTFTVSCIVGGSASVGHFRIVGSVAGTVGTATVGIAFSSGSCLVTVNDGAVDFVSGDVFKVIIAASNVPTASQWSIVRYTAGQEMIAQGPGAGSDSIFVGILTVANTVGDYQNWKLGGFTGFNSAQAFNVQPGYSGETPHPVHLTLWDQDINYWFIVNGRRIIVIAKVSTVYVMAYMGFITTYASPGQFPYPIVIGGNLSFGGETQPIVTSSRWRWSDTNISNTNFNFAGATAGVNSLTPFIGKSQCRARLANGTWRDMWALSNGGHNPGEFGPSINSHNNDDGLFDVIPVSAHFGCIWPTFFGATEVDPNLDGTYPLFPVVLLTGPTSGDSADALGEFEGIFSVTGYGLSAEDIINTAAANLVVPNVFRNAVEFFTAVKLT